MVSVVERELRDRLLARLPVDLEILRARLHSIAASDPEAAPAAIAEALGAELAEAWGCELGPERSSQTVVGSALAAGAREAWLWVMGERTWRHTAEGLAGRAARRAEAAASSG